MTIKITNEGIICSGITNIPDGTLIPFNYNPDADTTSSEAMRGAAAAVLRHVQKDQLKKSSFNNEYVNKADYLDRWETMDAEDYKEESEDARWERQYNYTESPDYIDALDKRALTLAKAGWRKQDPNKIRKQKSPSSGKTKRILNPVTGKYYELRQRSTKHGDAGQIKGLWSSKKPKKVTK
jgi:hypothetical protein